MRRKKSSELSDKRNDNGIAIIIAFVGLAGTFITAYFGFRASAEPTAMIIRATQTAQAITAVGITPTNVITNDTTFPISTPSLMATYLADCPGYERVGEWNQAAECYKQRVIVNPEDFTSLENVARVYGNGGQYDKMVDIAREMMAVAHNPEEGAQAALYLGAAYYNLGEYSSAIDILSLAENYQDTSSYLPMLIWLARAYDVVGDKANACNTYQSIIVFQQQNNPSSSIDEYQSGVQRNCH